MFESDAKETRVTVCLVHGNPETSAVWDRLAPFLHQGPVVRLSPPGFGAPVPPGFTATVEEYRSWLVTELERLEQPVHLVGHDWGGGSGERRDDKARPDPQLGLRRHRTLRPGLPVARSRAGVGDPGSRRGAIAAMIEPPVTERAAALVKKGMHEDVALPVAEGQNATMGECILRLYRDAAQPAMALLGRDLERAAVRPGLSIMASEDHLAGTDEQRRRASTRAGAEIAGLEGLGHWWLPKTHNEAPRPSTTSGQEWDTSNPRVTIGAELRLLAPSNLFPRDR
jgi:pimeloyl-ACP methyl ester carboxylesterase